MTGQMVAKHLRDGRAAKAAGGRKAVGDYPFGHAATGKGRERDAGPTEAEQKAVARIVELRREGQPSTHSGRCPAGHLLVGCSQPECE